MLPRMSAPAPLRFALVGLVLGFGPGCGDDEGSGPAEGAARARGDGSEADVPWAQRLSGGRASELLAALSQPHADVRAQLGPHHLHTHAVFDLAPPEVSPPELDEPVVTAQHVDDELDLEWTSAPGGLPVFSLHQANDHDRGRDVIVVDERVYFKRAHRAWQWYPLESELWQAWTDDAVHTVHDAVELAAGQLAYSTEARGGEGWNGGDAIAVSLRRADDRAPEDGEGGAPRSPARTWRSDIGIDTVEGSVLLDAATGVWLKAEISIGYALEGADGRALAGHLELTARMEPSPGRPITAPADAAPLPERTRYEVEAERLLDGLAAP